MPIMWLMLTRMLNKSVTTHNKILSQSLEREKTALLHQFSDTPQWTHIAPRSLNVNSQSNSKSRLTTWELNEWKNLKHCWNLYIMKNSISFSKTVHFIMSFHSQWKITFSKDKVVWSPETQNFEGLSTRIVCFYHQVKEKCIFD